MKMPIGIDHADLPGLRQMRTARWSNLVEESVDEFRRRLKSIATNFSEDRVGR
jgi:hypothetical protein